MEYKPPIFEPTAFDIPSEYYKVTKEYIDSVYRMMWANAANAALANIDQMRHAMSPEQIASEPICYFVKYLSDLALCSRSTIESLPETPLTKLQEKAILTAIDGPKDQPANMFNFAEAVAADRANNSPQTRKR